MTLRMASKMIQLIMLLLSLQDIVRIVQAEKEVERKSVVQTEEIERMNENEPINPFPFVDTKEDIERMGAFTTEEDLENMASKTNGSVQKEEDLERYVRYWYSRLAISPNNFLKIDSQLSTSQNQFTDDNRFVYIVTAPSGYQIRGSCKFNLQCSKFQFYFSSSGRFPDPGKTTRICANYYNQQSTALLKTSANVFQARYRFSKYDYRYKSRNYYGPGNFNCLLRTCDCGRQNGNSQVGYQISSHKYPFYAGLSYNGGAAFCGATLISKNWLLTAASCVDKITYNILNRYSVILGSQGFAIENIIMHPSWNRAVYANDIAVIKLKTPVNLNSQITPVCLPYNDVATNIIGETALAMGFDTLNNVLRDAYATIASSQQCRQYSSFYSAHVTNNMFCSYDNRNDACVGDFGGPLIVKRYQRLFQVGIVSWGGQGCTGENKPQVYTNLYPYLEWIKATTNDDFCWS